MDRITLKSLQFHGKHGYYDRERKQGNQFEVDITAWGDFKQSAGEDNLRLTFNYLKAEEVARKVIEGKSRKLIETLCSHIGDQLFKDFSGLQKLQVSVRKLNPPIKTPAKYAEILMEWNR